MVEYLYNAIRATSGEAVTIAAKITDDNGEVITSDSYLEIYSDVELLETISGIYDGEMWDFIIPEATTKELKGRYWYCIKYGDCSLSFKQPIYFI